MYLPSQIQSGDASEFVNKFKDGELKAELKDDFKLFDDNNDNSLDASEIRTMFPEIKDEDLSAFFIAVDAD